MLESVRAGVGTVDIAAETTTQVLSSRRLALLSRLNDRLADAEDVRQLLDLALPVLRSAPEDLPGVDILLPEEQQPTAAWPAPQDRDVVVETTEAGRIARIRLTGAEPADGEAVLVSRVGPHLAADEDYLRFFRLLGAALAQGLHRARTRQAERRATAMERELAEELQRSLLAAPAQPDHTEVAVAMSEIRSLLRGISYALGEPPAAVLTALQGSMQTFGVDVLATVVLAQIEPDEGGYRTLRWSNAGHPGTSVVLLHRRPGGALRRDDRRAALRPPAHPLLRRHRGRPGAGRGPRPRVISR